MPGPTAEQNLGFVLTCLQNADANSGKIDFETIAADYGMTKHAAYLRLWNLKKKNSGPGAGGSDKTANGKAPATKRGRPAGSGKGPRPKKQKLSKAAAKEPFDDNEEHFSEEVEDNGEKDDSETEGEKLVKVEALVKVEKVDNREEEG